MRYFRLRQYEVQSYLSQENLEYPVAGDRNNLMDLVDSLLLDYLIQNIDRHVFYFEPTLYGSLYFLDHGKGSVLYLRLK